MSDFLEKAMAVGEDGQIEGGASEGTWWKPEEGDVIGGRLVKGYYQGGDYGINPVLVIDDVKSGNTFNVGCSTKMLKEAVADLAPPEGTNVVIQYVGQFPVTGSPDRSFKRYIVRVEGDPDFAYWQAAWHSFQAKQQMAQSTVPQQVVRTSYGPDEAPF